MSTYIAWAGPNEMIQMKLSFAGMLYDIFLPSAKAKIFERMIEAKNFIPGIFFSSFKLVSAQSPKAKIFSLKAAELPPP